MDENNHTSFDGVGNLKFGILFWANKFYQHFHFIGSFLEKYRKQIFEESGRNIDSILKRVDKFERGWSKVFEFFQEEEINEENLNGLDDFNEQTMEMYENIQDVFKSNKIPCVPSLLEHMMEELQYFQTAILQNDFNLLLEIAWWANEHAENIDFVDCELPRLLKVSWSHWQKIPQIVKMMFENRKLAYEFKNIHRNAKEILNNQVAYSKEDIDLLYYNIMAAKLKHFNAIRTLESELPHLPLEEDDKRLTYDLLEHEYSEALFAKQRITHFFKNEDYFEE